MNKAYPIGFTVPKSSAAAREVLDGCRGEGQNGGGPVGTDPITWNTTLFSFLKKS